MPLLRGAGFAALLLVLACGSPSPEPVPRPLEPRLSGEFLHVECEEEGIGCRGAGGLSVERLLHWTGSAERSRGGSESEPESGADAEAERRSAVAALVAAPSAASLESAHLRLGATLARHPESAETWNDYAAVLWARFRASGRGLDAFQALEAVERALALDGEGAEAASEIQFNRALITQELGLRSAALDSWRKAAELEPDPQWRGETLRRFDALETALPAQATWESLTAPAATVDSARRFPWRTFRRVVESTLPALAADPAADLEPLRAIADVLASRGDPLIRHALDAWPEPADADLRGVIADLGRGIRQLEALETEEGERSLASAAKVLGDRSHPLRWNAELGRVIVLSYQRSGAALERVDEMLAETPPYPSIRGRLHWLRGILLARRGEMKGARKAYEQAAQELRSAYGEHPAAYVELLVGEAATYDGRLAEATDVFAASLPAVSEVSDRRRLHASLAATGAALEISGLHHAARTIHSEALRNARLWGSEYGLASSLRRFAVAGRRTGRDHGLDAALEEARSATQGIGDPTIRRLTLGDLDVELGRLHLARESANDADARRVRRAAEIFEEQNSGFDLAQAELVASRIDAALGRWPESLESVQRALAGFQPREARPLERPGATGTGLYRSLESQHARALFHAGRIGEAVAAFERARLAARGQVPPSDAGADIVHAVQDLARLHDATLLLLQEGSPVLRFVITGDDVEASEVAAGADAILRLTAGFSARPPEEQRSRLARLGELLLPPDRATTRRLVVIADPGFDGVPWPGVIDPRGGRPLVETTSTATAPHLHALLHPPPRTKIGSRGALVVAAPQASPATLPGVDEEARAVHVLFGSVLGGSELVTHPRSELLEDRLASHRIFHFAGHSRSHPLDPYARELLLAPGETLTMQRVLDLDLRHLQLAFLSSCDSASMVRLELPGPGFADALLAAGVQQVVGTLWPVDDEASVPLVEELYRRLLEGALPMDALREATLRIAGDLDDDGATAPDWKAYRVTGSVLHAVGEAD